MGLILSNAQEMHSSFTTVINSVEDEQTLSYVPTDFVLKRFSQNHYIPLQIKTDGILIFRQGKNLICQQDFFNSGIIIDYNSSNNKFITKDNWGSGGQIPRAPIFQNAGAILTNSDIRDQFEGSLIDIDTITLSNDVTLDDNFTLNAEKTLTIDSGKELIIESGKELINKGNIIVNGTLDLLSNSTLHNFTIDAATATINNGEVTNITVDVSGSGYTSVPTVTITDGGGGSGATATAILSDFDAEIILGYKGSGYTSVPTVTIDGGGGSGATATTTLGVVGISRDGWGNGYTSSTTVEITGGGGSGATATATINAVGQVTEIRVTNQGSGYTSVPTVDISGGGGSGANAIATLGVVGISQSNYGQGYTNAPTVTINGGKGTDATATATINSGQVTEITLISGSGYVDGAPDVIINDGLGNGVITTATINDNGGVTGINYYYPHMVYNSTPTVTFTGGKRKWSKCHSNNK